MSGKNNASSGGVGFFGLLTILFIALKLLGKITWSWWLVLSPIIVSLIIVLILILIIVYVKLIK